MIKMKMFPAMYPILLIWNYLEKIYPILLLWNDLEANFALDILNLFGVLYLSQFTTSGKSAYSMYILSINLCQLMEYINEKEKKTLIQSILA